MKPCDGGRCPMCKEEEILGHLRYHCVSSKCPTGGKLYDEPCTARDAKDCDYKEGK